MVQQDPIGTIRQNRAQHLRRDLRQMRYLGIKLSLLRWAGTPRISVSAFQDSTHRFATTRCLHQMRRCKWRQWKGESIFRDAFPDSTLLCAITRCLRSEEHTSELQ